MLTVHTANFVLLLQCFHYFVHSCFRMYDKYFLFVHQRTNLVRNHKSQAYNKIFHNELDFQNILALVSSIGYS